MKSIRHTLADDSSDTVINIPKCKLCSYVGHYVLEMYINLWASHTAIPLKNVLLLLASWDSANQFDVINYFAEFLIEILFFSMLSADGAVYIFPMNAIQSNQCKFSFHRSIFRFIKKSHLWNFSGNISKKKKKEKKMMKFTLCVAVLLCAVNIYGVESSLFSRCKFNSRMHFLCIWCENAMYWIKFAKFH